jgi:ABC-type uncharacterized transport system involved in gliding motility auxiliary subunit
MFIVAAEFVQFNVVTLVVAVLLSTVLGLLNRVVIATNLKTRLYKNIFTNLITIFLVFCIYGIINFLVSKNDIKFDLTREQIHSLSGQSLKIVDSLKTDKLKFTLFAKRNDWPRFLNLLDMYAAANSNIDIKAIDVDKDPALVKINKIKENGTLLVEYKGSLFRSKIEDELSVTKLLMTILRPSKQILYSIVGHNEMSFDDVKPSGLSVLREKIINSNFILKSLEIGQVIPKDAGAILIMNPRISFLEQEINLIKNYLGKGGKLLLTMSPDFSGNRLKHLNTLLESLGVEFKNAIILDRLSPGLGGQASIPIVSKYPEDHLVTKGFSGRTLFPVSAFYKIINSTNYKWTPLAQSTAFPATWGETSFEEVQSGKAQFSKNDFKGPMNISLAGENGEGRVILFSSASFISNQFQGQTNNFNLFLNSLAWVVNEKTLFSLDRPKLEGNLIYISDIHFTFVFYFAILLFPFIFFVLAIISYRRKMSS